jgi:site-specific recombinase XerC
MEGDRGKSSRHLPRSSAYLPSAPAGALRNIRIIQDLLGQSDIQAAVIYAHGLSSGLYGDVSPGVSL